MHDGVVRTPISTKSLQRACKQRTRKGESRRCTWLCKKFIGERRQQLILTFAGTALIGLGVAVTIALASVYFVKVSRSLDTVAQAYRQALPDGVCDELGKALAPIYRSVVRWRATEQVFGAWPPLADAYQDDREFLGALAPLLHTELDAETHVRHMNPDGLWKIHQGFVSTGAVLALQSDLTSPATNLAECAGVGVVQLQRDHLGTVSAVYQRVVDGQIRSNKFRYDPEASSVIFPAENQLPVMPCSRMMEPVWNATQAGIAAGDWTWILSDWGLLSGSLPIFSVDRSQTIGRMFSTVDLGHFTMVTMPLLYEKIRDTDWKGSGHLVLYTPDGRVIGQTETEETVLALDALPSSGLLSRGISELRANTGQRCPTSRVNINTEDGLLIDVRLFMSDDYGMPPLREGRWCLMMTLPRENLYGDVDEAKTLGISAGIAVMVVQVFATTWLALAVFLGLRIIRAGKQEKLHSQFRKVQWATQEVELLNCPMALISAENFLQLQRLEPHESLRDEGRLVILDSLDGPEGVHKFQDDHMIVFFSHQWVGSNYPDSDDSLQLESMRGALRIFQQQEGSRREIYLWVDYVSIAQRHPKMMMAAVSSLPVYASIADAFVIVAPPVVHAASGKECNLETYSMRGWCRAEMLAKACGSGLRNFYACTDTQGDLTRITDLAQFSLNVFEGDFTVPTDKESLVQPVLGLYSLVLRAHTMNTMRKSSHMQKIYEHISRDREAFFPRAYTNPLGERVELFGPCAELLEYAMEAHDKEHEVEVLS